jgi:predicted negative regulator of RcsB-dependent stress response
MPKLLVAGLCSFCLWHGILLAHEDPADQSAHYAHLLDAEPANPDLHLQQGEMHRLAGRWADAEAELVLAAEFGADASVVSLCRAALELDQGRPQAALAALAMAPHSGSAALFISGRALRQLGRWPAAAAELTLAVASSARPCPEDYLELADTIAAQGEPLVAAAIASLDTGLMRLGPVASLTLAAVEIEVHSRRFDAALARLAAAPASMANTPKWLARRGEILRLAGRDLEAEAAFTAAAARIEELPAHRRTTPAIKLLEQQLRTELSLAHPVLSGATP